MIESLELTIEVLKATFIITFLVGCHATVALWLCILFKKELSK